MDKELLIFFGIIYGGFGVFFAYQIIYKICPKRKLFTVGVYLMSVLLLCLVCCAVSEWEYIVLVPFFYISIAPLLYYMVISIVTSKKEKSLYRGVESQIRYKDDVIRTEYEDTENVFCRCMVTEPKEYVKKGRLVLIVPSLPPKYGKKYYWFIDYNGNCYNSSGNYREFSSLYNYAPYNEIADALAEAGNVVVRLDMFGKNPGAMKGIDHAKDVTAWVHRIQELKRITEDPVVIGHRENGLFAVQLMKNNHWKRGILICSGLNYRYVPYSNSVNKSIEDLLPKLPADVSLIQIDAELDFHKINKKEKTAKLRCAYTIRLIKNMDFTLRYFDREKKIDIRQYDNVLVRCRRGMGDGIVGKGYCIKCGTGKFPPVYEKLVEVLRESIDLMGEFA